MAVAAAAAAGTAGCGATPAQLPAVPAPAAPSANAGPPIQPPPPQGVPAAAWDARAEFLQARSDSGRPLPEPAEAPVCTLPGSGCYFSYGGETLVWSAETGLRALRTEVFERWKSSIRTLGWPLTSEYSFGGDRRTDFEKGTLMYSPRLGRIMSYEPSVGTVAVVIGDSQAGRDTWVGKGVASLGYSPLVLGAGGTGYTRGNGTVSNYPDALEAEEWLLPWGKPGLVVIQGGGNDAYGPGNSEIRHNAVQLIRELKRTYPETRIVMVGVIGDGKGRRAEIDDLLARVAAEQGLDFLSLRDWWKRYSLGSKLDDGLHLGKAGHDAAAPVFARELKSVLDRGGSGPG
ncbi:SGNH/GDSL hydrolase family protein [Arthrobacter gandavensis]|uniref:GDSL-type esterase/lipase family protein n=1 Tax=Arthrobacter gandavensis TaxID=169960 RepID=UPI00188E2FDB|nr:SGNH/GDSL hydrolase family protein [Arthrobacter gandavensis]MBF4993738.1 SGNH/GDSL hydrolase family protein [Arthrobacter gandavensis]